MRLTALLLILLTAPTTSLAVTIATVPVGNAGNAPETHPGRSVGEVDYAYEIGTYEVTNAQYIEFLNKVDPTATNTRGLFNSQMNNDARGGIQVDVGAPSGSKYSSKAGRASNPVVFVSFYDALRFTNWLHNGQTSGGTESGSYTLSGGTPIPGNGELIIRNPTATWCLPSEDEWYKAAFHKNDGVTGNYWDYPTRSNTAPASDQPPGGGAPNPLNAANFFANDGIANGFNDGYAVTGSPTLVSSTNYLTNFAAYNQANGPYGTFDQGGNAWEWNDDLLFQTRRVSGGSWFNDASFMASTALNNTDPNGESFTVGFRVARVFPANAPGDYNLDGSVDAADYTIWRNTLGSTTDLRANGDNTGTSQNVIDTADYNFWKTHFGEGSDGSGAASVATIPEPSSLIITFAACCAILTGHRTARANRNR